MTLLDTLRTTVGALDAAGIPHMIAGSLASTYHGEPRTTQDVDIVIDPPSPPSPESLEPFADDLDHRRFDVGDHADAFAKRQQFKVIDTTTGWKVDLIVRREREYSHTEFGRRQAAQIEGISVYGASPEDTILTKLEWARLGESEKHRRDAQAVVRMTGASLDRQYLPDRATRLGVRYEVEELLG